MMKRKALLTLMAASMLTIGGGTLIHAAFDENLNMYTLDAVVVEADKTKNKFGDTITEQSYYRTGGDVKVITREEIEKRHYTDVTEAIKRIPGITFQNPGYRGGEYGWSASGHGVAINGDYRVIVLVDGRRVDNATSTRFYSGSSSGGEYSKSTNVDLNQVTNMENVDKIEVIKGPGASVYGSDATGGVINIITRKGGQKTTGSVDLSTGNWSQHKYAVNVSGSSGDDKSFHYFISANREMSGDTEFKDGFVDKTATLGGSRYKEDGVNVRLDKDFDENHNLKFWYNHKSGRDGYPLTTQSLKYWNPEDWGRVAFTCVVGQLDANNKLISKGWGWAGEAKLPGYHNIFNTDSAIYGSSSYFSNNDLDVVYTFNKENGMDSFIRIYDQNHKYAHTDKYRWGYLDGKSYNGASDALHDDYMNRFPNGATKEELKAWMDEHIVPFPGGDKDKIKDWLDKTGGPAAEPTNWRREKNRGIQLQYAKSIGVHDIISSVTYDKAKNISVSRDRQTNSEVSTRVERKSVQGYVQDKIHVNDKWDITPSLRYAWYSSYSTKNTNGQSDSGKGSSSDLNYALNTEYMFNDSTSIYAGWTRVYRPIKKGDYTTTVDITTDSYLQDEEGDAWTIGIRKELSDRTTLRVNYDWTHMTNTIASLPLFNPITNKAGRYNVNAKEDKKAFNITLDTQLDDHWTISAAYDHVKDKFESKNGWEFAPSFVTPQNMVNINSAINSLRPQNHYSLNLSYDNDKLYSGLLINWYTGNNTTVFSDKRFLILDWNINYEIHKGLTLYGAVNNLTNVGYQTSYSYSYGAGSMPGRSYLFGVKYNF